MAALALQASRLLLACDGRCRSGHDPNPTGRLLVQRAPSPARPPPPLRLLPLVLRLEKSMSVASQ